MRNTLIIKSIIILLIGVSFPIAEGFSSQGELLAQVSNRDLGNKVRAALENDEVLSTFSIVPLVAEGKVTLFGVVNTLDEQKRIDDIVGEIEGVQSVINKVLALQKESANTEENGGQGEAEPVYVETDETPVQAVEDDELREEALKRDESSISTSTRDERPSAPSDLPKFHVVKPGESLREIAQEYGLEEYQIRQRNGMAIGQQPVAFQKIILGESDTIMTTRGPLVKPRRKQEETSEDDAVVLEVLDEETATETDSASPQAEVSEAPLRERQTAKEISNPVRVDRGPVLDNPETILRNNWIFHRVQEDEKDHQIADHYNISLDDLRGRNGIGADGALRTGTLLRIKKTG